MSTLHIRARQLVEDEPELANAVAAMVAQRRTGAPAGLTPKQETLLAFIIGYRNNNRGVAPSYEEMRRAMGVASKGTVHRTVDGLVERGYIRRLPGKNRAITLLQKA